MLQQIDTILIAPNIYLENYIAEEFKNSKIADQLIDPKNIDTDLASAAIFFEINDWRLKKRREIYHQHSKLDRIANQYVNYYKRYRFRSSVDNYVRLKRTLNRVPKYVDLDFSYLEGYVELPAIVDYEKGSFYYNEELGTSDLDLYHGRFSKEEDFVEEPMQQISYAILAERVLSNLLKSKSGGFLRSKAYEILAVRVAPTKRRKSKRFIPKMKVIYLIGAYRNKIINELEEVRNN